MADIFISYKREDYESAEALSKAFESHGWSVWWDNRLNAGESFDLVIQRELDEAKCVVVLWSSTSIESRWVITEASEGLDREILVPVFIEKVRPPLVFRRLHTIDLVGWDKTTKDAKFIRVVRDVTKILSPAPQVADAKRRKTKERTSDSSSIRTEKSTKQRQARTNNALLGPSPFIQLFAFPFIILAIIGTIWGINKMTSSYQQFNDPESEVSLTAETVQQPDLPLATPTLKRFFTNDEGIFFQLVNAGEFKMGSKNAGDDEKPEHNVIINTPFYMGVTEVTQKQWVSVMDDNPSYFKKGENHPVESVSWNMTQEFIEKLNTRDDQYIYRLPTEAEWEYACRAGTSTDYSLGYYYRSQKRHAVYGKDWEEGHDRVASKESNPWFLFDMLGNVREWTSDWYDEAYYKQSPSSNPQGPVTGEYRVHRGGSFGNSIYSVRCEERGWDAPDDNSFNLGFRLVAVPNSN